MIGTLIALRELLRSLGRAVADPATRGLVAVTFLILAGGTLFYRGAEGWSAVDALYFSVITLTTIGFGDLTPTSDGAKLFTVVYTLLGIGVVASFVTSLAIFARNDWEKRYGRHRAGRRVAEEGDDEAPG
jgi:voltage-gated potassium channel